MTEILLKYNFDDVSTEELQLKYCCFKSGVLFWINFFQDMYLFPSKKRSILSDQSILQFTDEVDVWLDATNSSARLDLKVDEDASVNIFIIFDNERDAVMFKMAWM